MQLEYINSFVDSSCEILMQYIKDGSLKVGEVSLKDNISSLNGVAAMIGLTKEVSGNVVIELNENTSDKVVSVMNDGGKDLSENIYYSTVKELANLIAGLAVTKLEKLGIDVDVTPPIIIKGSDMRYVVSNSEALHVRLESSIGILNVLVSIAAQ